MWHSFTKPHFNTTPQHKKWWIARQRLWTVLCVGWIHPVHSTYSRSICIEMNWWPLTPWCISFISRCEHPVYPFSTSHIYLSKPELHPILCDCSLVYTVHFSNVVWHAATKNGKSPIWFWFEVHIWFGFTVWSWVGLWFSDSFLEFFNIYNKN